jgi:hypothetical protein
VEDGRWGASTRAHLSTGENRCSAGSGRDGRRRRCVLAERRSGQLFARHLGRIAATAEALVRIVGQNGRQRAVKASQVRVPIAESRNDCVEALTDDGDWVRMLIYPVFEATLIPPSARLVTDRDALIRRSADAL